MDFLYILLVLLTNLSIELREVLSSKISTCTRISSRTRPTVLRALYTVGLICKYFSLDYFIDSDKQVVCLLINH